MIPHQQQSGGMTVVQETRSIVAVVLGFLSVEFAFHELGSLSIVSGLIALLAASLTVRNYLMFRTSKWMILSAILSFVGVGTILHGLDLEPLQELRNVLPAFVPGPRHGLLGIAHLFADFSVIGLGIYQVVRWYRLRNSGCGVVALASVTGCCGSTAVVLTSALSSFLGPGVIHSGVSFVVVAAVMTATLAALAYAWVGQSPISRVSGKK